MEVKKSEETRTIAIVKPHAVAEGLVDEIERMIRNAGLSVLIITKMIMSQRLADELYKGHSGKDYHPWLKGQITSGEVAVMLVEGENASRVMRELAGPTKPENARIEAPNSIRALLTRPDETFERSRAEMRAVDNVIHTSDPEEEGAVVREGMLFFPMSFC